MEKDVCLGVLVVGHQNACAFTEEHQKALQRLADFAASAIQNHDRLHEANAAKLGLTSIINAIQQSATFWDIRTVLNDLAEGACIAAKAKWVSVFVYHQDTSVRIGTSKNTPKRAEDGRPRDKRGHTAWVLRNNTQVTLEQDIKYVAISDILDYEMNNGLDEQGIPIYDDPNGNPIGVNPDNLHPSLNVHAVLCLPLLIVSVLETHTQAIGTMWFHYDAEQPFTPNQIEHLQHYTNLAALVWRNVDIFTSELDKKSDQARRLSDFRMHLSNIVKETDQNLVIQRTLEAGIQITGAKGGAAYRPNSQRKLLTRVACINLTGGDAKGELRYGEGLVGRMVESRQKSDRTENYATFSNSVPEPERLRDLGSVLAINLLDDDRETLGAIALNATAWRGYNEYQHELEMLTQFAIRYLSTVMLLEKIPNTSVDEKNVFVNMPYESKEGRNMDRIYKAIAETAQAYGLNAKREKDYTPDNRTGSERIREFIKQAKYVVAVLTEERQNVHWEHGYAYALNKILINVAESGTTLHYDVEQFQVLFYTDLDHLRELLTQRFRQELGI